MKIFNSQYFLLGVAALILWVLAFLVQPSLVPANILYNPVQVLLELLPIFATLFLGIAIGEQRKKKR